MITNSEKRLRCRFCGHYSWAHGPNKPCKALDVAGDECDCEEMFVPSKLGGVNAETIHRNEREVYQRRNEH